MQDNFGGNNRLLYWTGIFSNELRAPTQYRSDKHSEIRPQQNERRNNPKRNNNKESRALFHGSKFPKLLEVILACKPGPTSTFQKKKEK
jgi:hypothetical protein